MEWWIALIVVVALAIAAAAAVGLLGGMTKDPVRDVYRQDLPARPLDARDVQRLRFGVTLRGYAMSQVDDVLDRLGAELTERDALLTELLGRDAQAELERRRHRPVVPDADPPVEPTTGADPDPGGRPAGATDTETEIDAETDAEPVGRAVDGR